ncbi:MAG: capsid protein, partial [Candidatus Dojkabacteria bacterium]
TGIYTYHNGNFSNTYGVVFHEEAVGTVKLMDIATEMDRLIEYQADLMVGKYAMGHGILRPECAVELISA